MTTEQWLAKLAAHAEMVVAEARARGVRCPVGFIHVAEKAQS